jgi:RHS repeat-associated protein
MATHWSHSLPISHPSTSATLEYDSAGRLVKLSPPTGSAATFAFDALGRSKSRTVGALTDTYGYLGPSETVFAIAGGSSTRLSAFDLAGSRLSVKDGATLGYLVPDLLGSVVATETSSSTAVASALRYDGYGRTAAQTTPAGTVTVDHRFTGALDRSSDSSPLYDIGARDYSPASGAWTQLDTFGGAAQDPASMNRFLYAHANPTTLIDPTGHFPTEVDDEKHPTPEAKQRIADNIRKYGNANGNAGGGGGASIIYVPNTPEVPTPGPAPCGGSSASPCPTPRPPFETDPIEIDPVGAAVAACSVAAPPPAQVACDAKQFAEALDSGDPVEVIASGVGFIWYVGDGVKYLIKGGKAILVGSRETEVLRLLTSGRPGSVTRNALSDAENELAGEVVRLRGGHFNGQYVDSTPGLDGWLEGAPASLKHVYVAKPRRVLERVGDAEDQARLAGLRGVDVYVDAQKIDMATMMTYATGGRLMHIHGAGVIKDIYVRTSDGWMIIVGG